MRFLRPIPAGLVVVALFATWAHAAPFNLQHGERPDGWTLVGGNELAWRYLNGALNSGNGDAEGYENPSYFYKDSPGSFTLGDYTVSARVLSSQENGTFTLLARFQDPQNYYGLEYRDRSRMGRVRLVKVKDGDIRYDKSVGHGFRYDDRVIPDMTKEEVSFRIEARGDRIRAWVNDDYEMEIEDGDFTKGTTGFANFFYNVEILDFAITPLIAPDTGQPETAGEGPARIEFREAFTEDEAQAIKNYLDDQQFSNVEIIEKDGRWIVRTGVFPSAEQAEFVRSLLESEGIVTGGTIVPEGGAEEVAPPISSEFFHSVVVAEYDDLEGANVHKNSLAESGFTDVTLVRDQATNTYKVLFGTFETRQMARDAAAQMNAAGFTTLGTTAVPRTTTAAPVTTDVDEITRIIMRRIMKETDQSEVQSTLAEYRQRLQSMEQRDEIIETLRDRIDELTTEQKKAREAREEEQQEELDRLLREVQEHIRNNDLDDARIKANMVLQRDPLNRDARVYLDQIRREELDLARAEARAEREAEIHSRIGEARRLVAEGNFEDARMQLNAILGMGTREEELSDSARRDLAETRELLETVNRLRMETEMEKFNRLKVQAEKMGDLERVLIYLENMARLDPDNAQIMEEIRDVSDRLREKGGSDKRQKFILFGLVVFVVLFALFYFLTSFLQRRQEAALAAREEEILQVTYEPATDNFQEEEPAFVEDSVSLNFGGLVPFEAKQEAVAEGEPTGGAAGRGVGVAEPPSPPPSTEIDTGEEEGPPAPRPQAGPRLPAGETAPTSPEEEEVIPVGPGTEPGYDSLDDLLSDEEDRTDMVPSFGDLDLLEPEGAEGEKPEEQPVETGTPGLETPETGEEMEIPAEEPKEPKELPAVSGDPLIPEPVEGNLLFKQGFDGLSEGSQPLNWEAEAMTLNVAGQGKGGIGKCLRVEKKSGGEALARCRFHGIKNIFRTELDIKTEAGLQGEVRVSIERGEEAPDLVHVLAAGGGEELVLQGTKTQSEPGEWRHVKFIINLDKQVVNGFVDGKLVAYKVGLASAPAVVDTISIRADAEAEGAILIDNIKIYRV